MGVRGRQGRRVRRRLHALHHEVRRDAATNVQRAGAVAGRSDRGDALRRRVHAASDQLQWNRTEDLQRQGALGEPTDCPGNMLCRLHARFASDLQRRPPAQLHLSRQIPGGCLDGVRCGVHAWRAGLCARWRRNLLGAGLQSIHEHHPQPLAGHLQRRGHDGRRELLPRASVRYLRHLPHDDVQCWRVRNSVVRLRNRLSLTRRGVGGGRNAALSLSRRR